MIEKYEILSELEKEVCQACAVAFFQDFRRPDLQVYLNELGITHEIGKKLTYQMMNSTIDSLVSKQILGFGLKVDPKICHQATLDALNGSRRERYLQVHGILPGNKYQFKVTHNQDQVRRLRLLIYLLTSSDHQEAAKIAKEPLFLQTLQDAFYFNGIDQQWLDRMPDLIQTEIFRVHLGQLWNKNVCSFLLPHLLDSYKSRIGQPGFEAVTKLFLQHAVNTADLRLAAASLLSLLNLEDDQDLAIYASILFLRGEYAQAIPAFEQALKLAKKRYNLRKYFFQGIEGVYYILSLLQCQNPQSYAKVQENLNVATGKIISDFHNPFKYLHGVTSFLTTGISSLGEEGLGLGTEKKPSCVAFICLCQWWIERSELAQSLDWYKKYFEITKGILPGIARIFAEVLSLASPGQGPYEEYLKQHQDLYTLNFPQIIASKEEWERSLEVLERLYPSKEEAEQQKDSTPHCDRKLVWLVDPEKAYVIGALEQKVNARGQWTKGRPVALERLKRGGPDLDYATEHDKKVMGTIVCTMQTTYGYYKKEEYSFNQAKALAALVGHPNIVDDATDLPLEFVKGSVEMILKQQEKDYSLSLSHMCSKPASILKKETDTRFQVIDFTEEHVKLLKLLGPSNQLTIPKTAKKRLQTVIKSMEKHLPVQSELDEESVRKEGDSTLYVQLAPINGGLKINLLVRPFGTAIPQFRPGHGFQTPQTLIKGKNQRVLRNLQEERSRADQLIRTIEYLEESDGGYDEWIFEDPEEVLEVLSALHEYPHPIKTLWPNGKKMSVSPPLTSKALFLKVKSDQDWFSLEGEVRVGEDKVIELKQLLDLIDTSSARFLPIGEEQFLTLTEQFRKQLRELKAISENERGKLWIHSLSAAALDEVIDEQVNFEQDKKWKELKQRRLNAQAHIPIIPTTLQAELRPYQEEGFYWLSRIANWGAGACLADDMGLGKTLQALALVLEHANHGPTLVVAPSSVCHNWLNESARFAPSLEVFLHADTRSTEAISTLGPRQLLVTSYGLLHQESQLLSDVEWQTVILDEAQVIKNINTKRSQAAMQLRAKVKLILTGTPMENRLSELWNLFRFINPGLLGSFESFSKRFVTPIEQRKDASAKQVLKKLIQPFILRRLKSQVLTELPPRIEKTLIVPLSKEEQAFYEAVRRSALEKLTAMDAQDKKRMHILAEIMRLRRACCHSTLAVPEIDLPSSKLNAFLEILEELRDNNHRALVFSQFVGCLEKVRLLLDDKGISYQYLDGSTPIDERQKRVDAFQGGQGDLFLISLKAGGTGLNLTAADYVVHLDPWWNPAVEDQASDRAHRIGQTRPVTIYRIIMEGTIEEKMIKLHENKRGLVNDVLEGTNVSGKLSEEELIALLEV